MDGIDEMDELATDAHRSDDRDTNANASGVVGADGGGCGVAATGCDAGVSDSGEVRRERGRKRSRSEHGSSDEEEGQSAEGEEEGVSDGAAGDEEGGGSTLGDTGGEAAAVPGVGADADGDGDGEGDGSDTPDGIERKQGRKRGRGRTDGCDAADSAAESDAGDDAAGDMGAASTAADDDDHDGDVDADCGAAASGGQVKRGSRVKKPIAYLGDSDGDAEDEDNKVCGAMWLVACDREYLLPCLPISLSS